jgi:hypothetical protein
MKSEIKLALVGVAGAVLLYGGWAAYRAHRNLVTLDVRDMPIRQVVKKLQWQTWETIVVHSNLQGKVTMNVRKVPLEEALKIVDDQISSSHSVLYPLYSKGSALTSLKKALRGEVDPMSYGWTNLQARGFFGFGGRGGGGPGGFGGGGGPMGMGGGAPAGDGLISLDIQNKDVAFATLALGRFGGTRVVPEDGANSLPITLKLDKATVDDAVGKLAKKAHRSYARLYALRGEMQFGRGGGRGGPGGGGPPDFAQRDGATNMDRRMFRGPDMTDEQREQMREQRMMQETQLLAALPAEDRQKMELAQQQRQEMFQQVQNMAPEQRQQFMEQRFGGQAGMQQRGISRIKNTTPEQRAERTARRREFDYMRFQGIQPQGRPPGGGGGGGRPGR